MGSLASWRPNQLPVSLLRTSLLYAFHADTRIDIEGLARKFENHKKLSDATMTIAEELIAKGKAEGELRGRMIGKIQLLEFKPNFSAVDAG